jgi:hypothetical protein
MRVRRAGLGGRISAIFGGVSGGLGTFGTLHNVCHYTCQVLVTGLGLIGLTLTGLPLAFLEDPKLVVLFGGLGVISLGGSLGFHLRAKRAAARAVGRRRLIDRRAAILAVFLLASTWSLAEGTARMIGSAGAEEAATRTSKAGTVEVELTLLNLKDASLRESVVFAIAMNSMDMSAPSFETYDLKRAITLEIDGTGPLHPADVRVSDWGHMGHHLRGQVTFPVGVEAAGGRVVRLTIRGFGGVQPLGLEWRMPRTR